jgi:hypothetical protein
VQINAHAKFDDITAQNHSPPHSLDLSGTKKSTLQMTPGHEAASGKHNPSCGLYPARRPSAFKIPIISLKSQEMAVDNRFPGRRSLRSLEDQFLQYNNNRKFLESDLSRIKIRAKKYTARLGFDFAGAPRAAPGTCVVK